MRWRRLAAVPALYVTVLLSVLGCSGGPAAPTSSVARATAKASPTAPAGAFTVSGVRPVLPNGSQDTRAQGAGTVCDSAQLASDKQLGNEIADGFGAANFPAAADLLRHFLAGRGTRVDYPAGSRISRLAAVSSAFLMMNRQVQAAIASRLKAGDAQVRLAAGQLPTVTFSDSTSDLYWSFRGTQGLTVTGSGRREQGRYVGTLTYVIADSYGFPVDDTLGGFGPPMRYLQTVCGAPQNAEGAHWFPDSVTVTTRFDQPA